MSDLPLPEPSSEQVLDIQHDLEPAQEDPSSRHIPNLGHALLFFLIAGLLLNLCAFLLFAAAHVHTEEAIREHPGLALLAQAAAYGATLGASFAVFPALWKRSFPQGIQWNLRAVPTRWFWLVPTGIVLSAAAQGALHFFATPKETALQQLMSNARGAWWTAAFGVLLAPMVEEIAFRGFLLPALATVYDWLLLERTPAGLQRWRSSAGPSTAALVFATIFSSIPFALLHAGQLSHAAGALSILYLVSLALSYVRIRTASVACSTLVHASYNLSIFMLVFVGTGGFRHLDKLQ